MSLGQPGAATWPLVFLDVDGVLTTSEELLTAAASHVPLRASCVRNLATAAGTGWGFKTWVFSLGFPPRLGPKLTVFLPYVSAGFTWSNMDPQQFLAL